MGNCRSFIITSIGILFTCIACVKDPQNIPGGAIENPVFRLSGQFGSEQIQIAAGENEWTIQPLVEELDANLAYTSLFSKNGCVDACSPSLEFKFHRALPGAGQANADFEKTFQSNAFQFVPSDVERDSFEIMLSTHPGLFMSGYSYWEDLNNNGTTLSADFASTIGYSGNVNVCFQSLAYTGCQYMQCIYFDPATLIPCISYIEPKLEGPRYLSLTVRPEGTAPFQVEWFNQQTSPTILVPLQSDEAEVYAGVKVTDALGNISEINQIVRVADGHVDACYFPISLTSSVVNNSTPEFAAGKVEIIYTDDSGEVWSSTAGVQSLQSFLQISAIDHFGLSPLQQEAFTATISFAVDLFNTNTGEKKVLTSQQATIALAHP